MSLLRSFRNCKDSAIPATHRYFERIESSKFATYQGLAGLRCKPHTSKTRIWTRRMCRCARSPSRIKLSATHSTAFIGCRVAQPLVVIFDDWLLRRKADAPSFKFRVLPSLLFTSLRSPLWNLHRLVIVRSATRYRSVGLDRPCFENRGDLARLLHRQAMSSMLSALH